MPRFSILVGAVSSAKHPDRSVWIAVLCHQDDKGQAPIRALRAGEGQQANFAQFIATVLGKGVPQIVHIPLPMRKRQIPRQIFMARMPSLGSTRPSALMFSLVTKFR